MSQLRNIKHLVSWVRKKNDLSESRFLSLLPVSSCPYDTPSILDMPQLRNIQFSTECRAFWGKHIYKKTSRGHLKPAGHGGIATTMYVVSAALNVKTLVKNVKMHMLVFVFDIHVRKKLVTDLCHQPILVKFATASCPSLVSYRLICYWQTSVASQY